MVLSCWTRLTASSRCHHGHVADSELLTSLDYIVPYDHGQFWLCSCLCVEEDYPLDVVALPDYDEMASLDYREIQDEGIWQIPVEYSFSGMLVVLSPHQNNFEMPLRVEVWDGPPPDDITDWPEAFEAHLEVDPHGLYYSSTTGGSARLGVPPGGYHALITGRGFVAHGWPGSTTPGDSWRIRLWPSPGPQAPRRLSAWHGERELRTEERRYLEGLLPQGYRLVGLDREPVPAPRAVVRAIDELVGRLRADSPGGERAAELARALGSLLGQQWCSEFGWEWRLVSLPGFEGYGVVPSDSRYVYFAIKDIYDLLISETDELNLLLLFNMVAAGNLPPASGHEHVSLG